MNKDTETKFEKTENLEDDYYDYNNDNNIMDVALGNIKDDPASIRSRPRRLKYWQLTLEDEDKIPKNESFKCCLSLSFPRHPS